jgi:hypothetical protein
MSGTDTGNKHNKKGSTMKTKHTPGPWTLTFDNKGLAADIICKPTEDDTGTYIALMESSRNQSETRYNGFLIASAPDMLAALIDIEAIANGTAADFTQEQRKDERFCLGAVIGAARKAIRQAQGEI